MNALTGMFVGTDNPLYYIYSTFRGEFAYFRNVGSGPHFMMEGWVRFFNSGFCHYQKPRLALRRPPPR